MHDLVERHMPTEESRICVVAGGSDRNETIFNVIAQIEEQYGVSDEHLIVTHDAVRPFVTLRMIEENIDLENEATLWIATVDDYLNENKYIVPGLGDAGDLCFGAKL
jgi:2-C-methyl-D-erythritol 4-phosphate cytidylyltransferase